MNEKRNFISSFVAGARKGFTMSTTNMMPNVLFAFAIIQMLNLSGLSDIITMICGPVMGIFGLPGIAATPLVLGIFSNGGALGATASLVLSGDLNGAHAAILLVGITQWGAMVQYLGRILGTTGINSKHYPIFFISDTICCALAMLVTSFIVGR